ncbi:uncharacterized protein abi3bpa isoform X5 [Hemitrygon akajei]|uniref:uncharacterized protein abi3bpa isoform X5 n=1 Tax=Hemitrygon akajei TaxID=2704970 RepID=UPI003BFA0D3A
MSVKFLFVIFGGIALSLVENARILPRVKRQSLKVRITAKDDSIVLQYLSTSPVIKLQGYVLGLGGRFSKQNITLPGNGDPIEVDVDFNPKYLVAVHPVADQSNAALGKKCKGIPDLHKPPQLSIDPRTPTSVFLTWGFNFKDKGYKVGKECESERQYTIRYREKERDKKWKYHLCPTREATIDNLKPNTVYEFGIRVSKAKGDGVWSKPTIYSTTIAPQPRSTKSDQNEKKLLNKVEVNFNSENPKHPKKSELPGKTNIKGMTAVKQLGAPSSAHNRTSLNLLPKKPEINTKAIVGSQSTSDRMDVQPEKSSSPKPAIIRKPEHTRDELHDKEEIKEATTNTISKPSLKRIKTRKESEKPAMKPLTTKESKLSSSVSPSFPSKPLLHSDRTEIQLPVFFTPSTASELDTTDKFTESETPSPTIMPFITLRTTSDHADVRNQDLPETELPSSSNSFLSTSGTTSALDSVETKQFSEPEMPPTSSKLSEPTSEPDDTDTQKFTEHKIRSFSTSSVNPIPESVSMDVGRLTELPSSTSSFSSSSNMASKPDVTDTMWLTEYEEPSSWNAFYITSLTTSAPDSVDYKQFTEYVVESTTNSIFTTSNTIYEFESTQRKQTSVPEPGQQYLSNPTVNTLKSSNYDAVEPKQSTDPEVSSFTTTNVFITSNPTTEADDEVQQPYAEYEVPISDINNMSTLTADHELPVTDTPNVSYPIPEMESVKIRESETTGHREPTTDTPSMFRTISGSKPQDIDTPNVFNMIPESVTTKIRVTEVTDNTISSSQAPNLVTLLSGYKLPVSDSPSVSNPAIKSEPAKITFSEVTEDHELSISHTPEVFTLQLDSEPQVTDTPFEISPILEPHPTKIREAEPTDIKVPVSDIANASNSFPESNTAKIEDSEVTDFELPVTNVFDPNPKSEATKIGYTEVTDNMFTTSHTPKVSSLIPNKDLLVTDTPNTISPNPETERIVIRDTEDTDHEVPTSNVPSLIPDSDLPATDIPNVLNPISNSGEIGDMKDDEVPSSGFPVVVTLMPDHELPVTANVINPIPEPEHANVKDNEITDDSVLDSPHMVTVTPDHDLLLTNSTNVISPIPEAEHSKIGDTDIADDSVLDSPHMVTVTPDHDLLLTNSTNVISPIPEAEHAKIRDTDIADNEVETSEATDEFSLMPDLELPVTDTPNVSSPIPEHEHAKIRNTEVPDHEVETSEATDEFSLMPDLELPVTDTPNVSSPIPEHEHAKIRNTEVPDHEVKTSEATDEFSLMPDLELPVTDIPNVSSPIPEHEHAKIRNTEVPDQKLPKSDDYASNPAPISERGYTEEQEFKAPEPTDSETSHVLISTPRSELDKKEDKEFTDYKQPASGTPNVLSQSQEPTHDKIKDEDLAGPKTPSTVSQLPSTSSQSTQESPPVFRSTPVSNIDGQGQERFRGPHVKYLTKENMPCSITESLKHFEEENSTNATALTAPKYPPSNLTLVTVEGCPTFLIVDWKKNENDTASEYEVVSQMQGPDNKTEKLVTVTNQTHAAVENLKPNTSYTFSVTPTNKHGRGPSSDSLPFVTESADPSVSEYIPGKDAIWTQYSFKFDSYSECQGKRFVKRTRYRKFVGIVLCNSLRYKIYLSNSLSGIFYNIGDLSGHGEDHCQFVDSFLDGRTGEHLLPEQLPIRQGFYRSVRQEPVMFGTIGGQTHINYVHWYECGIAIPGQW